MKLNSTLLEIATLAIAKEKKSSIGMRKLFLLFVNSGIQNNVREYLEIVEELRESELSRNIDFESDYFTREWITYNSIRVLRQYEDGILTIRALHYQLVGLGMTNDVQHYKRVVAAMEIARWDGSVAFEAFSDRDRAMVGKTKYEETVLEDKIEEAKTQIGLWMRAYSKNKWENQRYYPEILIEKKALEGVFARPCQKHKVALGACKGYPSLTFLNDLFARLREAHENGKIPVIIYFGDYDPSGDDIPRSIVANLERFGMEVELRRVALNDQQVKDWKLPHAPTKETDSRTAKWDGIGQVELDAVKPEKLIELLDEALADIFDEDLLAELIEQEEEETIKFQSALKSFALTIGDDKEDETEDDEDDDFEDEE